MQSIQRTAIAIVLGAACTLPVMAQGTAGGNTGSGVGASSQPQAATPATQPTPSSTAATPATQSDTRSMGAGPQVDDRPQGGEKKKDLGWLGLLGLVGLLGLRRKHDDTRTYTTTDGTRRTTTTH